MKGVKLRPYQQEAADAVVARFVAGEKSTLVVMPTGTGKTVLFAAIIDRVDEWKPGGRILVMAHREELIRQAAQKIHAVTGHESDIEMAGERADVSMFHRSRVVVASKDTLRGNRLKRFKPEEFGLIITDEAHHAIADTYVNVYTHFKDVPHLGVTATPDRTDEEKLGSVYQSVAFDYELPDAIRDGWLCPIRQRSIEIKSLDYSHVHTTAGDLNGRELAEVLGNEKVLQQQADATLSESRGRKTLVFATPGFKRQGETQFRVSERLTEIFNRHRHGIARLVTGETPKEERQQTLRDYKDGLFQILVNVGVFTEGFDDPSIELVVMTRATKSRSLYAQIVGRGTRPLPGIVDGVESPEGRRAAIAASAKPWCEVLDFEGNAGTHKLIHVTDILGDKYTPAELELANRIVKKSKGSVDVHNALDAARGEIKLRDAKERFRRAWIVGKAKWDTKEIDPFNHYDVDRRFRQSSGGAAGPTDKQIKWLKRFGVKIGPEMTRAQASAILGRKFDEKKNAGRPRLNANKVAQKMGWKTGGAA